MYKGPKYILLTTVGIFGGRNEKLPWAYWCLGVLCLILASVFDYMSKTDHKHFREYEEEPKNTEHYKNSHSH